MISLALAKHKTSTENVGDYGYLLPKSNVHFQRLRRSFRNITGNERLSELTLRSVLLFESNLTDQIFRYSGENKRNNYTIFIRSNLIVFFFCLDLSIFVKIKSFIRHLMEILLIKSVLKVLISNRGE